MPARLSNPWPCLQAATPKGSDRLEWARRVKRPVSGVLVDPVEAIQLHLPEIKTEGPRASECRGTLMRSKEASTWSIDTLIRRAHPCKDDRKPGNKHADTDHQQLFVLMRLRQ